MAGHDDQFIDWIKGTIKLAFDCLDVSRLEVLIRLEHEAGRQEVIQYECMGGIPSGQDKLKAARDIIASFKEDGQYYGLIWSGSVQDKAGKPLDVIAVETGSRTGLSSFITQPYKVTKDHLVVPAGQERIAACNPDNIWTASGYTATSQLEVSVLEIEDEDVWEVDDEDDEEGEVSEEDAPRLDELVSAVISTGFQRLQAGIETPFACLAHDGEDSFDINEPDLKQGEFADLVNSLRDAVASNEAAQQYAIGYMGNAEDEDGEIVQGLYVEAGDMNGQAPVYFVRYTVSDSGVIQPADEVELYEEGENLWVGDDESDSDDDESDPSELNELVERVFSIAVDRLQEGNNKPWACYADTADEPLSILDPGDTDASSEEILEVLRQHVATLDQPRMYAIVFSLTEKTGGKDIHIIVVEAGERDGEAPVFGLTYKLLKSGKVQHEEIEFSCMIDNLWS